MLSFCAYKFNKAISDNRHAHFCMHMTKSSCSIESHVSPCVCVCVCVCAIVCVCLCVCVHWRARAIYWVKLARANSLSCLKKVTSKENFARIIVGDIICDFWHI